MAVPGNCWRHGCWLYGAVMPTWYNSDGSQRHVSQDQLERLQDEADAAFYEAYALAKWLAWQEWAAEFGENNPMFPFRPNDKEVFAEAERLMIIY